MINRKVFLMACSMFMMCHSYKAFSFNNVSNDVTAENTDNYFLLNVHSGDDILEMLRYAYLNKWKCVDGDMEFVMSFSLDYMPNGKFVMKYYKKGVLQKTYHYTPIATSVKGDVGTFDVSCDELDDSVNGYVIIINKTKKVLVLETSSWNKNPNKGYTVFKLQE